MHEVNQYITDHYSNWLDHAEYQCSRHGIPDEAVDVLNEVMAYLLKKDEKKLLKLRYTQARYGRFADGKPYMEIDIYVLAAISLNVTSPTSPYQSKYKRFPSAEEMDFSRLEIEDDIDDGTDKPAQILEEMHQVRKAYEYLLTLGLPDIYREVFEWRFFNDRAFIEWPGDESKKELYDIYNKVKNLIKQKINGEGLF
nr:hypothetical protein [uncultured Draconibacterium sp.]